MRHAQSVDLLRATGAASGLGLPEEAVRVLVVDDEPWHRALQREILNPPRYDLHEAQGGEEALRCIEAYEFDVVLLDERMPGLTGEVALCVREERGVGRLPSAR